MSITTAEDIRQRVIDRLGSEFGDYFFHLDQSVIGLVSLWDLYRSLFGTNKERVDLLNQASGYVTRAIQDSLHERIILGVCQISDPYDSRGRKNVTVLGLPKFLPEPEHCIAMVPMIDAVKASTSFARDLRNKMIAHSDLEAVTGSYAVDYSTRERIVAAIQSIIVPLRYVHVEYFGTSQLYHAIHPLPDAVGFLRCIYIGAKRLEEKRKYYLKSEPPGKWFPAWLDEHERNEFDSEFYLPTGDGLP